MAKFIRDMEVETVAELKKAIAELPDDMEVCDGLGELCCLRIYEDTDTGQQHLEVV